MSCLSTAFIKCSLITVLFALENLKENDFQQQSGYVLIGHNSGRSAVCVCSKINVFARTAIVYVQSQYVYISTVRTCRKNILCLCICVWDGGLGYSVVQIAELWV